MNLQFFGGRGSSSGLGGGRMTIAGFLKNFRSASESDLGKLGLKVDKALFTENGNSIKLQSASVQNGADRVEVSFYSNYNPLQVSNSRSNISSSITIRHYKDGDIQAYKEVINKKTKSVKMQKKIMMRFCKRGRKLQSRNQYHIKRIDKINWWQRQL